MLDKSIPYFNIIMKRRAGLSFPQPELPHGFSFAFFTEGTELYWSQIETSVGEFNSEKDAFEYFHREYLPSSKDLHERLIFIRSLDGHYIATITTWWNYTDARRDLSVHWLAVKPEFQGFGLGKALIYKCLEVFKHLEGEKDIYLHTQTWSYKAVGLYLKNGFEFMKVDSFGNYQNEFDKAEPILKVRLKEF